MSIVVGKHLEATLKIIMSVQWISMYYTIVEYGGCHVVNTQVAMFATTLFKHVHIIRT